MCAHVVNECEYTSWLFASYTRQLHPVRSVSGNVNKTSMTLLSNIKHQQGFLLFVTVVVVVITIVHISMIFIVNTFTIIIDIITIINIVYTCMVRRLLKHFLSSYTSFYNTATFFPWFPLDGLAVFCLHSWSKWAINTKSWTSKSTCFIGVLVDSRAPVGNLGKLL